MNILLTNDDGHFSQGINLLKEKLSKYGRVVVIAPKEVMSAKSVSITLNRAIEVVKKEDDVYICDGTPADCVAFGLSSFNIDFDLVVSGVNHGLNISYDTMYSGTIGACLQALTFEVPAIAFSCENNFSLVEEYFDKVFEFIIDNKLLSKDYLLNVNFPIGDTVKDIKLSSLYYRDKEEATYYVKENKDHYLALRNVKDNKCKDTGSDVYMVHHDIVSITKLNKINY